MYAHFQVKCLILRVNIIGLGAFLPSAFIRQPLFPSLARRATMTIRWLSRPHGRRRSPAVRCMECGVTNTRRIFPFSQHGDEQYQVFRKVLGLGAPKSVIF